MAKHIHIHLPSKKTVVDRKVKDAVPSEIQRLKDEISTVSRKIDKMVMEGARIGPNDPLQVRLNGLRRRLKQIQTSKDAGFTTYDPREVARLNSEIKELEAKIKAEKSPLAKKDLEQVLVKVKRERAKYHDAASDNQDYEVGHEKGSKGYRALVRKNGRVVWLSSAQWLTPQEAEAAASRGLEAHSQGKQIRFEKGTADATEPKYLLKSDAAVPPNKGWKGKTLVNGDIIVPGSTVIYKSGSGFVPWYNRNATPMRFSPSNVMQEKTFDTAETQDSEENDAYIQGYNDALAGKPKDKEFHPGGNKKPSVAVKYAEGHEQGTEDRKSKSGKDDGQTLGIRA